MKNRATPDGKNAPNAVYEGKEQGVKLKQDDVIEVEITDNGMEGEGIARYGGYTVFVPFAITGEKVKAKITYVKKELAFSQLKEVLTPSPLRVKPPCNRFGRCGGCNLMHMDYEFQLKIKRDNIVRLLQKNALCSVPVEEVVPCSTPFAYRNKIQLPFGYADKRVALGFYRENTHKIVSITKCFLHGEWAEKLINIFLEYAARFNLSAYDEITGTGHLKHLVARYVDGKLSVTVVTDNQPLRQTGFLIKELKEQFGEFSLYQSKKPEKTNVIMGKTIIPIKTAPLIIDELGIKTEVNPYSFLQLNEEIRDKIYLQIAEEINAKDNPVVIDAYAGIGILGAVLAKRGARVYNIEIVPEATQDGDKLAKNNCLEKSIININGDAAKKLPLLIKQLYESQTDDFSNLNIILDPPRKGCSEEVINAINGLQTPHTLYYISCNPATLSRDLFRLKNYEIRYVKPYDMFCNTSHVEVLVSLCRK